MKTRFLLALLATALGVTWATTLATSVSSSPPGKPNENVRLLDSPMTPRFQPTLAPMPSSPTIPATAMLPPMTPAPTVGIVDDLATKEAEQPIAPPPPTPGPNDGWRGSVIAERRPSIRLSTSESSLIVIGRVTEVGQARWSTPDGTRPLRPWETEDQYTIFRPVTVEVQAYVKGKRVVPPLVLFAFGGQLGKDEVVWESDDLFTFNEDERVVVFLKPDAKSLGQVPLWTVVEHYTVTPDGTATNGYETMPLQELIAKIASFQKP